jgi:hypothetical protein
VTAETIAILAGSLPDHVIRDSGFGGRVEFEPTWGYNADVQRFISAYRDMDFGWRYVRALVSNKLPFLGAPLHGDDEVLFRAYLFCRDPKRYKSPDIELALALAMGQMTSSRATVEGLLLSADSSLKVVAKTTGMPVEAIQAFERLFFNVVDRREDTMYLQSIVYPHGRMVELVEGYLENTSLCDLIRRAGYNNGAADVLYLMGASSSALDAIAQASSPKQLESLMMAYGYMLARNGGMNQARGAGLNNAKALLTAGKLGGETIDDTPMEANMSTVLKNEMMRWAQPAVRLVEGESN